MGSKEFAPMRTGQLVVRYHTPKKRRVQTVASVVGVVLCIYGAFELGRYRAGYDVLSSTRNHGVLSGEMSELRAENAELRRQIAGAQLARDVNEKSYADVERNLSELQAQVLRQREELAFYRGIVSPEDGIGALRVQRFQVAPAAVDHVYKLRLVLVQSMRQDGVVNGAVDLHVNGTRAGRAERLNLHALGVESAAQGSIAFSFRYFQNLEQEIALPADFEPHSVDVAVKAGRGAEIKESYPWKVQVET